jgi:hypothetical protein
MSEERSTLTTSAALAPPLGASGRKLAAAEPRAQFGYPAVVTGRPTVAGRALAHTKELQCAQLSSYGVHVLQRPTLRDFDGRRAPVRARVDNDLDVGAESPANARSERVNSLARIV